MASKAKAGDDKPVGEADLKQGETPVEIGEAKVVSAPIPLPRAQGDIEAREFTLVSNVMVGGRIIKAGSTGPLTREGHAELFALGAVTEPWPEGDDTQD